MSKKTKASPKAILAKLTATGRKIRPYSLPAFLIFVALLYGFVLLKITSLRNAEPSADAVSSQVKAAKLPHIDEATINQLQSLQDNSVSVQTLFEQARNNPFQ